MADITTTSADAQTEEFSIPTFTATIGGVEQTCVDARLLHACLKNGRQFADWINARVQKYGFEEGSDYDLISQSYEIKAEDGFSQNSEKPSKGGRPAKDYRISLDMAKELSMIENNEQGRKARRYFLKMERIAIQAIKDQLVQALAAKPAIDYTRISPAQAQALKELVNAEARKSGKHHQTIWTGFQHHFEVNSYLELPASRFDEACKWLGGKRIAAKPAPAQSYDVPAVDFDFHHAMNDGMCDPKPMNSGVRAVLQQHSWKLAGEAQVGILQFLERFISYRTNDDTRTDTHIIGLMLEKITLSHCLAYRYFEELDRARQMADIMQSMASQCVNSIKQRMGTVFA